MEYSECLECSFVLQSESSTDPRPKRWPSCPRCEGAEFRFVDGDASASTNGRA